MWDAEFRDTPGATVEAQGAHRHTVFYTSAGKRAVVVVNEEANRAITVKIDLPTSGKLISATPEELEAQVLSGPLEIPARSAAVIMEI